MATVNISAEDFEDTITSNDIVLVDFWAEWCSPCKRFGPIYEKASEEYSDIVFAKVDSDANPELSQLFDIQAIPTLMAFRENVMVFNQAGALPGADLKRVIEAVKGLDMVEVHKQVEKLRAEHSH
jgi:thioredoxin 1